MITILEIKKKFKENGYNGKLPIKKQELIELYENMYGKIEEESQGENLKGMTLVKLKEKLKMMGYSGKIPIKKSEIIDLIENLGTKKDGFKYQILENLNFNKIISKLTNHKLDLPKNVELVQGIEIIQKHVPHIQTVVMNLNTTTNTSTFSCSQSINDNDRFIFLLIKDESKHFDFVKINEKILLTKDEIPQSIYTKLSEQCETLIPTQISNNKCDLILDKLNVKYTVEDIQGDGNCFYRFVAAAHELDSYKLVRQRFADNFSEDDWMIMNTLFGNKLKYKKIYSREDYVEKMLLKDGVWVPDSIIEMLYLKSFPDTSLVLFDNDNIKCNLVCPLITVNKYFIFGRYQKNLHYDLYKINGKTKLTWDEIPSSLQEFMLECKNFAQDFEKHKVKYTDTEFDKISQMTVNEIKLLFQQKNYIGKLPIHKKELLDLFKELFVSKEKDVEEEQSDVDYDSMSLAQITEELKKKNITKHLPRKKDLMIKLLKAPRCKPLENKWCTDDSICDVMNNVCVDSVEQKGNIILDTINSHKISGSKSIIKELKSKIKEDVIGIGSSEEVGTPQEIFKDVDVTKGITTHKVSNKNDLLKYLKELHTQTTLSSFNNFLKSVV